MVRKGGLEPPRVAPPAPKAGASANSATFAWSLCGPSSVTRASRRFRSANSAAYLTALQDRALQLAVRAEDVEVRRLACSDLDKAAHTEHTGRIAAGGIDGPREFRTRDRLQSCDRAVHRQDRACKRLLACREVALQKAPAIGNRYFQPAEQVIAIGHPRRGDAVGDEDCVVFTLRVPPEPRKLRRNVDAIAYQFGVQFVIVQHHACNARLAVVELSHRVEGVRCTHRTRSDSRAGLRRSCVGVPDANADTLCRGVPNQIERSFRLRRNRHQLDVAARSLLKSLEQFYRRLLDCRRRMHSSF